MGNPATIESSVEDHPNRERVRTMDTWPSEHEPGTSSFAGLVGPSDATVVTTPFSGILRAYRPNMPVG